MGKFRLFTEMIHNPLSDLARIPTHLKNLHPAFVRHIDDKFETFLTKKNTQIRLDELYTKKILTDSVQDLHPVIKARLLFLDQFTVRSTVYLISVEVDEFIHHSNESFKTKERNPSWDRDEIYLHLPITKRKFEEAEFYSAYPLKGFLFNILNSVSDTYEYKRVGQFSFRVYEAFQSSMSVYVVQMICVHPQSLLSPYLVSKCIECAWENILKNSTVDKNGLTKIEMSHNTFANLSIIAYNMRFDSRTSVNHNL